MTTRATPISMCALLLAPLAAGCAINLDAERVTHTDEHRFRVTERAVLVLSTFDGAVRVEAWDEPEVLVTIRKRAEDLETARALETRVLQEGDRITVDVPAPQRRTTVGINVGRSASMEVRVPRGSDVQVRTGDGAIDITGIAGRVEARSGDGAIRGTALHGDVVVSTGDGSIGLDDTTGRLDLHSGDGSITAHGTFELVKARTGDGSVSIRVRPGSRIAGDWEITTGDGSVSLELPAGLDAELDAYTGDGRVSVDGLGVDQPARSERNLRARLGAGGSALKVRTGDGSITLRGNSS